MCETDIAISQDSPQKWKNVNNCVPYVIMLNGPYLIDLQWFGVILTPYGRIRRSSKFFSKIKGDFEFPIRNQFFHKENSTFIFKFSKSSIKYMRHFTISTISRIRSKWSNWGISLLITVDYMHFSHILTLYFFRIPIYVNFCIQ